VLVDSREANIALYKHLLTGAGYPEPSREAILECFHLPLKQSIKVLTGLDDLKEVERIFAQAKTARIDTSSLFKFPSTLVQTLEELHERYKLAVVTSRIHLGVADVFKTGEIGHLFNVVVAFEDYSNPKPQPEPLLMALQKLGVTAEEAIYIGDSDTDIEAAREAHMRSIHLSRTPHTDATAAVQEFDELVKVIHQL
jgi:HAD superfamily hydrolase (TIGR01509 family)